MQSLAMLLLPVSNTAADGHLWMFEYIKAYQFKGTHFKE